MSDIEFRRKCAKCHATASDDANLRFHRFPLPGKHGPLKAQVWAEYCFPDGNWSSEESLKRLHQQHKMLCSKHFHDSSYTSSSRQRLNNFAIPIGTESIMLKLRQEQCSTSNEINIPGVKIQPDSVLPKNEVMMMPELVESKTLLVEPAVHQSTSSSHVLETLLVEPAIHQSTSSSNIPEVPHTRKGILRDLELSKSEMTPRKRKLYVKCRKNLSEIIRLRKKIKNKRHSMLPKLVTNENVQNLIKRNLTGSFALLLQSQLKNTPRKLTGHRWSVEDKVLALSIYKKSTACYRLLKRLFCLPSEGTLKALLNKIPMKCGINHQIFETVKQITETREPEENLCVLAFDEMSICKNLSYNVKQDIIDGYQDHGNQGRTMEPATHALLFMAIGIRKRWKQPLAFYFSGDCVTADRLSALIKEVLDAAFQADLDIIATVCDNFGVNIKALNSLGSSVSQPYFDFKGHEIVTIMDPPHLLKCFRNNFLKYDIECTQAFCNDGKPIKGVAKWNHIKEFYEKDNANPNFVFAPALTKQHIEPNFKQKMKVSLACQVLSHSVAAGMLAKIANNELPPEATTTAMIIEKMDQLFDALNGDTPDLKRGKKYLTNLTQRSQHLAYFKEMKTLFKDMKFVGARAKPPSIDGFIRTLNAVERLSHNLYTMYQIKSLSTRRLNQDPLENCFGCIRSYCGCNSNPNTIQFVAALKTAMIGNLLHSNKNKNCKDDDNVILNNLKAFLTQNINEQSSATAAVDQSFDIVKDVEAAVTVTPQWSSEMQACAYVCGFMIKKLGSNCKQCQTAMLAEQNTEVSHLFASFKEYDSMRSSLMYVNSNFTQTVETAATIVNKYLNEHGCELFVKNTLQQILNTQIDFEWLLYCSEHFDMNRMFIIVSTITICIKRHCIVKNRLFSEEASKRAIKRKLNILQNI